MPKAMTLYAVPSVTFDSVHNIQACLEPYKVAMQHNHTWLRISLELERCWCALWLEDTQN